jgi:hypothetical protein
MPAPTLIRRELKNARIYFIPVGEVVDSVTVANATWPDNVPLTNWTNYQIPDIETVKSERTVKSETFSIPNDNGGYTEDTEEMVTSRKWTATTHKTNSYLKQLENGLAATAVASSAQTPGGKADNFIDGVMLLEIQNKGGTVIERTQVWARLRLVSGGEVGPATSQVEFSLELRQSTLNTYVAYA